MSTMQAAMKMALIRTMLRYSSGDDSHPGPSSVHKPGTAASPPRPIAKPLRRFYNAKSDEPR